MSRRRVETLSWPDDAAGRHLLDEDYALVATVQDARMRSMALMSAGAYFDADELPDRQF